jgi:hypothetical protein
MGLPFKESSTSDSVAKQFSSIQLTKHIYNGINEPTPFDIGTDQSLSGFQTGAFAVINENASLYNNNGGFIIRKKGFYKIECTFRMLTSKNNPVLSVKKNNVIVDALVLCCFNNSIAGSPGVVSQSFTILSNIIDCNIGDVITFDIVINSLTSTISGLLNDRVSYINIIEI